MSLKAIVAGDYGQRIRLTFVDVDTDAAADISAYSSVIEMIFTKPNGESVTKTASFVGDGSDGRIEYTLEAGFLTAGVWRVRGRVQSGAAQLTSERISFEVID
jgi:hypothetical protein